MSGWDRLFDDGFSREFFRGLHAIPETAMLLQKENSVWLIVIMIYGAILQNSLQDGCLEKGVSNVKHSEPLTPQRQRGQMQGCVQQKLASAVLPYGDKGDQEETQKKRKMEKNYENRWKIASWD